MPKRKGRDWREWNEHITGMHRLDSRFDQPHLGSPSHDKTATAIRHRDLLDDVPEERLNIRIWVIVFLCALAARKCYFEFTKYDKLKSSQTVSRPR